MLALPTTLSLDRRVRMDNESASIADAREGLAYWRDRRSRLPFYRRAARAEARTMTWRWRARLLQATLERRGFELPAAAMLVAADGRLEHAAGSVLRRFARLRRRLLAAAAAATVTVIAAVGLLLIVAIHVL